MAKDPNVLSIAEFTALDLCSMFLAYRWKPAKMARLAAVGLVERIPEEDRAGLTAYRITDAGRTKLAKPDKLGEANRHISGRTR